ncbi:hypothetical protein [Sphingomonas sp. ID0503]|uniref:hypothetical protein n=1 Tax=Sphingomonas sp. ID0503 TaxID=3399691 RepID=UPI003AFA1F9A
MAMTGNPSKRICRNDKSGVAAAPERRRQWPHAAELSSRLLGPDGGAASLTAQAVEFPADTGTAQVHVGGLVPLLAKLLFDTAGARQLAGAGQFVSAFEERFHALYNAHATIAVNNMKQGAQERASPSLIPVAHWDRLRNK